MWDRSQVTKYGVILGTFLINTPIGLTWYYGNLVVYIDSYFIGRDSLGQHEMGSLWMMSLHIGFFTLAVTLSSGLVRWLGPLHTTRIGLLGWTACLVATYLAIDSSFSLIQLTLGVLGGLSAGTVYAATTLLASLWLPEKVGIATSTVSAGLGGGSLVINQCITSFINPGNQPADIHTDKGSYFSAPSIVDRVPYVFLLIAGISCLLSVVGFALLKKPPDIVEGTQKKTWYSSIHGDEHIDSNSHPDKAHIRQGEAIDTALGYLSSSLENVEVVISVDEELTSPPNFTPLEMLKTKTYYCATLGLACMFYGLEVETSYYKQFGFLFINNDYFLTLVGILINITVVISRIAWGFFVDCADIKTSLILLTSLHTITTVFWYFTPRVSPGLYLAWTLLVQGIQCGSLVVYPVVIFRTFGVAHYGINYGLLFAATSSMFFIMPQLTITILNQLGYFWVFFSVSATSCVSFLMAIALPEKA